VSILDTIRGARLAWKHRTWLTAAGKVAAATEKELKMAETQTDPRSILKSGRFWTGLSLIVGAIGGVATGTLKITDALTPDVLGAIGAVVAGIISIFSAKGQVRTEKMIGEVRDAVKNGGQVAPTP
jgi:hypothetical protein